MVETLLKGINSFSSTTERDLVISAAMGLLRAKVGLGFLLYCWLDAIIKNKCRLKSIKIALRIYSCHRPPLKDCNSKDVAGEKGQARSLDQSGPQ